MGFVVSFIGLKAVFQYEKYAGLVLAVVFIIMYSEAASFADNTTPSQLTGSTLSGTALTLFAVIYGSSASWCSIVADYYVEYPVNTSETKVLILTTLGICKFTGFRSPHSIQILTRHMKRPPNLLRNDHWGLHGLRDELQERLE